jgi:hypothetical protein
MAGGDVAFQKPGHRRLMAFSTEQQDLWTLMCRRIEPSGNQTQEQAENLAVASFRYGCSLEGIECPSEADIREAIARLSSETGNEAPPPEGRRRSPAPDQ